MESEDSRSETNTPTHATNQRNQGDEDDDFQLGGPNGPEDLAALMDQEDLAGMAGPEVLEVPMVLEVWAGPATTLPMSKTSCGNS